MEISELHKKLATTMVYVTHDQVEAMTMADKIVVLQAGVIEQVGSPLELYRAPRNKFVAGFIGSPKMNFFEGAFAAEHSAHTVGVRPEHIDVDEASDLIGVADVVEHLGSDTNIYLQVEGLGPLMVRKHGNLSVRAGDRIGLRIQPENVHLFAKDGTALRRAPNDLAA